MRNVLVVGGAGGLGAAVVRELGDVGLSVAVAGRRPPADERVRCARVIDATRADFGALYASVEAELGAPLDGVVFVAGMGLYGRTGRVPLARAREVFELNFWACAHASTAMADRWRAARRPGTFVAVLSIVARRGVPFEAHYAASKAAAARFIECLHLEHEARGLRFVSVYPGTLRTSFRGEAEWYGLARPAAGGADPRPTAQAIVAVLRGRRRARVIGWRERAIDLADRVAPALYDRAVLRRRVLRSTQS
jgi:2,3-dihydro-2,3-dihydroxybenzoate dehydrogenase